MVDGPNMYGYVKDRPVRVIDAWGLFTVTGDCNGKANDIQAMVQEACDNLDAWITPDLKACVEKRCKTGKVRCQKGCKSGCENGNQGYNIGTGPIRSHTAVICVDSPQGPGGFTDTAIHEWVHSCGYDEQDKNDKTPPYGDGK
jgi:hypothetical protein